jgi:YggT family protein
MSAPIQNALLFLITTLFDLYIFVLIVRLVLAWVRADYRNPLSQMFIKLTQPLVAPLRRIIPNYKNLELATLVLVIVLELCKFFLVALLVKTLPAFAGVFVLSFADALRSLVNLFFYAILIQAVMSWVNQGYSPVSDLLAKITAPIMRPFHRIIPPIGGIDVSPIAAMVTLQLIIILAVGPLFSLGQVMAFG